jgi:hypothetical protein
VVDIFSFSKRATAQQRGFEKILAGLFYVRNGLKLDPSARDIGSRNAMR